MRGLRLLYSYLQFSFLLLGIESNVNTQSILVTNEQDEPLIGVSIYSTDLLVTGLTDENGRFVLDESLGIDQALNFSFVGCRQLRLSLSDIKRLNYQVKLTRLSEELDEFVIIGRKQIARSKLPYQLALIKSSDITATQAQTTADALTNSGMVYVQKSQMGGGSPILRGFEANRVLLVIDGIRLNNAIFRAGHLHNIITVDPMLLDNMEVLFGPNSMLYGSDALGGVVYMESKSPKFSLDQKLKTTGAYQFRYGSANAEKRAHTQLSLANDKFGSLSSISYTSFGDLRVGSNRTSEYPEYGLRYSYQGLNPDGSDIEIINKDPNLQIGTAYDQLDVSQKFVWKTSLNQQFTANFQYSTSSDIPRIDNLSEYRRGTLRWAEWSYGPQNRLLSSLNYTNLNQSKWSDEFHLIAAHQRFTEERITRPFLVYVRNRQLEKVAVTSITADWSKSFTAAHAVDYGIDWQYNDVNSSATDEDLNTGDITVNPLSRYANGGNTYNQLGVFFQYQYHPSSSLFSFSTGFRFTNINYSIKYNENEVIQWPSSFISGVQGHANNLSGSLAAIYNHPSGWKSRAIMSTAFRAPNIDDLSKIRINGDQITFPNLSLAPERTTNIEWSIGNQSKKGFDLGLTLYHSWLTDAIVALPYTTPSGEKSYVNYNDTLQVVANQNIEQGRIYGISANLACPISSSWKVKSTFNYTRGLLTSGNETSPLGHIPPIYGQVELMYEQNDWSVRALWRYNGKKPLSLYGGGEDNPEFATPEGALAWSTSNLYIKKKIHTHLDLSLAAENILDTHYRMFSSGVSGAGRNLVISVTGSF